MSISLEDIIIERQWPNVLNEVYMYTPDIRRHFAVAGFSSRN